MRNIAVADCETDPFKWGRVPMPFLWGFYDGTRYLQFTKTEEFVKFLSEQDCICYAHNGGKFDWHYLLPYLAAYSDVMLINGRISKVNLGVCELRDSYNILPIPLRDYKKTDIDYRIMETEVRHLPENWRKITSYLKDDCVYLYELVSKFVEQFGLQITQASAAMQQWKELSDDKIPRSDKEFYDLISPYYYGGRVECFESGIIDTNFSVFDINSAYPFAMQQLHPYSCNYSAFDCYIDGADFYRVRCISRGAFPWRGAGNPNEFAGLRFPNDTEEREYTITGWEYRAAKRTKTISSVKVIESIVFDHHITFAGYIQHFYAMRMECKRKGDEAGSLFAKLLMNSLYGKFAANPENYRNNMIVPMGVLAGLEGAGWEFCGELGPWGLAEQKLEESQERYYNVATGASITGFVRAMLWEAIASSKGVLYCDTDSVAVRTQGKDIRIGEEIGKWKNEYEIGFDRASIAGKKLYVFRGIPDADGKRFYKTASKGARLTRQEIHSIANGKKIVHNNPAPSFSVSRKQDVYNLPDDEDELRKKFFTSRRMRYTAKGASK